MFCSICSDMICIWSINGESSPPVHQQIAILAIPDSLFIKAHPTLKEAFAIVTKQNKIVLFSSNSITQLTFDLDIIADTIKDIGDSLIYNIILIFYAHNLHLCKWCQILDFSPNGKYIFASITKKVCNYIFISNC